MFSYMSLGVRNVDDGDIDKMMAEAPGALNFTTFLNMLAEKLHGTDSEDVILEGSLLWKFDLYCDLYLDYIWFDRKKH